MPRARLTWYAEAMIPIKLYEKLDVNKRKKIAHELERRLIDKELAKSCIDKLKKLKLVGEWLIELWYFEILEGRKDVATGHTMEKSGLNVWRAEWIYTAVPITVIEMDNEIVKVTRTKKMVEVDNLKFYIEAYFTITEED